MSFNVSLLPPSPARADHLSFFLCVVLVRSRSGFSSESLLNFIRPKLTHSFELYRPRPWGKIISAPFLFVQLSSLASLSLPPALLSLLFPNSHLSFPPLHNSLGGALYGLFIFRSFFLPIVTSKHLWTVATLLIILTFTTGYMWNKIKDAPYMVMDREGRSQWLAGGFSNQYGAESQVVAVICESSALSLFLFLFFLSFALLV